MASLVGRAEWLDTAEVARLVRAALRRAFPADRFAVRSSTYSGGASIRVGWTDGPVPSAVEAVVDRYAGGGFDGSIDLAYNVEHWVMPDGSASVAYSPGTEGSHGTHAAVLSDPPGPDARLVRFGADHVFADRSLSPAFRAALEAELKAEWGSRERWAEEHRDPYGWDSAVWRRSCALEYRAGVVMPTVPDALERIRRLSGCESERCESERCVLNRWHGGLCVFAPAGELEARTDG